MKFHHIGIACRDIESEKEKIKKIHDIESISETVFDANQNANLCMITLSDGTNLELVSGDAVNSLVQKKITYYHICYEVNDIEKELESLEEKGAFIVSAPKEAVLFNNRKVAFVLGPYGLIELLNKV